MSEIKHPYTKYEGSPLWNIISEAISELVENQDIEETTRREYIVGYLVKEISSLEEVPEEISSETSQ